MRKFYFLFALCFAVFVSQAQETVANGVKENQPEEEVVKSPITFKISYHLGSSTIANHYMSANAYKGVASGVHVDLGRFTSVGKIFPGTCLLITTRLLRLPVDLRMLPRLRQ